MNPPYTNIVDDLRLIQPPAWWLWIGLGTLLLVLVGVAAYALWRRAHPRVLLPLTEAAIQAAQEDALAELEKLQRLMAPEHSRPYAIGASGVVRRYIERRFAIRAPRRSTEEFLAEAQLSPLLEERHRGHLTHFLACCDFLKFAKATADRAELELIHRAAVEFVKDTQEAKALAGVSRPEPSAVAPAAPVPAAPAKKNGSPIAAGSEPAQTPRPPAP